MGKKEDLEYEFQTIQEAVQAIWDELADLGNQPATPDVIARQKYLVDSAERKGAQMDKIQDKINEL
jgi:hypothetical protein